MVIPNKPKTIDTINELAQEVKVGAIEVYVPSDTSEANLIEVNFEIMSIDLIEKMDLLQILFINRKFSILGEFLKHTLLAIPDSF